MGLSAHAVCGDVSLRSERERWVCVCMHVRGGRARGPGEGGSAHMWVSRGGGARLCVCSRARVCASVCAFLTGAGAQPSSGGAWERGGSPAGPVVPQRKPLPGDGECPTYSAGPSPWPRCFASIFTFCFEEQSAGTEHPPASIHCTMPFIHGARLETGPTQPFPALLAQGSPCHTASPAAGAGRVDDAGAMSHLPLPPLTCQG